MAGRPTKLTDEMVKEAEAYLNESDVSVGTLLPTIEGLSLRLGISRDTIYEWEKENDQFSDIAWRLRSKQGEKLIQNALAGRYNASIAKLILSGKHGYVEQSEVKATIEQVTPILGAKSKDVHTDDSDQETTEA
jgi:DNA-binding XRE family transcriptional regulator